MAVLSNSNSAFLKIRMLKIGYTMLTNLPLKFCFIKSSGPATRRSWNLSTFFWSKRTDVDHKISNTAQATQKKFVHNDLAFIELKSYIIQGISFWGTKISPKIIQFAPIYQQDISFEITKILATHFSIFHFSLDHLDFKLSPLK